MLGVLGSILLIILLIGLNNGFHYFLVIMGAAVLLPMVMIGSTFLGKKPEPVPEVAYPPVRNMDHGTSAHGKIEGYGLCQHCGSNNIMMKMLIDHSGGNFSVGLHYQQGPLRVLGIEPLYCDICSDCGTLIRSYIRTTDREWFRKKE